MKKKLSKILVFVAFLCCLFFPMMFAGCGDEDDINEIMSELSQYYTTVTDARNTAVGTGISVAGYYVGVAQEGAKGVKEVLIKDFENDDIIAIRGFIKDNVSWPNFGYTKGNVICISGTVMQDNNGYYSNKKKYIQFSENYTEVFIDAVKGYGYDEGDVPDVTYKFDKVTALYSHQHVRQYFKYDNIQLYSYVKFVGTVYYNQQEYKPSDADIYRIHMNSDAGSIGNMNAQNEITDAKGNVLSNAKRLHLRENVLKANLVTNWSEYVYGDLVKRDASNSFNEYTVKSDELICLITGVTQSGYELTILDDSWIIKKDINKNDKQDAIVEVAKAFYRQGNQIRYDQTLNRKHMNPSPEDATSQNTLYLDCSSFVNAVYNETFGAKANVMKILIDQTDKYGQSGEPVTKNFKSYAKNNKYGDVVLYQERNQWIELNNDEKVNYLTNLRSSMQVGDVLSFRKNNNTGHCYLYLGNNAFIHCVGSSYTKNDDASLSNDSNGDLINELNDGSIYYLYGDRIFNPDLNDGYYLFSDNVTDFCVLRPLNRGISLSTKTKDRMSVRDLEFEKTANVGVNTAVYGEQDLVYSINIKNNSQVKATTLSIEDKYDSDLSYKSVSVVDNKAAVTETKNNTTGKKLTFKIEIKANQEICIMITYKVNSSSDKLITSNQTKINGVNLSKIVNSISGYTSATINQIVKKAKDKVTNNKGIALTKDPITFIINNIYGNENGLNLNTSIFGTSTTAEMVMKNLFTITNKNNGKATLKTDTIYKMVAPNLYGGYHVRNLQYYNKDIVRLITVDNLSLGDIIVAVDNSGSNIETVAYIYVGDDTLVRFVKGQTIELVKMTHNDPSKSGHVLVTLPAYDTYAVLRPSMTA